MRIRPVVAATLAIAAAALLGPSTGFAQEASDAAGVAQERADAALVAYQSGRYDEALNAFRQRVRVAQAPVSDHRHLGRVLLEVGRYEEAEQAARNFIAAHPDSSQLHNILGEALWATGRMDDAEEAFRAAMLGGADDYMTAELNLAIAAFDRGRRDEAMRRFDRFIDAYNDGEAETSEELTAVGIACRYLGINDKDLFHDSLRALDEAAAADPDSARPRILTGSLFLDKYDSQQAVGDLTAALEMNPTHPEGLLAMARRMQFDNEPGASETAGRALETNPNLVAAHVFRAHQLLTLERYDDALEWVDRALGVNPAATAFSRSTPATPTSTTPSPIWRSRTGCTYRPWTSRGRRSRSILNHGAATAFSVSTSCASVRSRPAASASRPRSPATRSTSGS